MHTVIALIGWTNTDQQNIPRTLAIPRYNNKVNVIKLMDNALLTMHLRRIFNSRTRGFIHARKGVPISEVDDLNSD